MTIVVNDENIDWAINIVNCQTYIYKGLYDNIVQYYILRDKPIVKYE